MLKRVVITNHLGESMEYRIDGVEVDNPSGLIITSIDGLGPVKANINMMDLATTDGQRYNSARLSGRNIVIKALFTHATSIEEARLLSYKYFPIKKKIKFRIETDNRTAETEGYVESNEPDIFSEQSGCQISILCENPYFDGGKVEYVLDDIDPLFKFEFGNASLDEPLIKISENIDASESKEVIYEGDADTGMEIEISVPSDDIMDSFSVTGIEIIGNGDKKIGIDTSKMTGQVPNSAPYVTDYQSCSYIMEENRGKFFKIFPGDFGSIYDKPYSSVIVKEKNELHCFHNDKMHLMIDLNTNKISRLKDVPVFYSDLLESINGKIYDIFLSNSGGSGIYIFNDNTNSWDFVTEISYAVNSSWHMKVVSYNNEIHTFHSNGDPGSAFSNIHRCFDGNNYRHIENLSNDYPSLFPSSSYNFEGSRVIVHNNKIHIFGGTNFETVHYTWDGTTWQKESDVFPRYVGAGLSVVSYKNKLHLFRPKRSSSEVGGTHYILNPDTNVWEEASLFLPYSYSGQPLASSDYMYFISSELSGSYTTTPNNDHLIENDRLVINTIKGKKGVTLYRDDNKYNVLNSLEKGSTWLQLHRGVNSLSYSAETGEEDMQVTLSTNKWYEGV